MLVPGEGLQLAANVRIQQNNADEGSRFTPQNTETEADFVRYVRQLFPLFTESDVNKTLLY